MTSISVGLASISGRYLREAAARVMNPLSYPRYMEYDLTVNRLGVVDGCRVLDIGSPKLPALLLARNTRCELYATDIRDYFIGSTAYFLAGMGLGHRLGKDLHLEVQDARRLTYPDAFFDRVFSISVLEHIPGDGDSQAMREIGRILRPGGVVTLTVPFAHAGYREEYVQGDVYERKGTQAPTFYQRRYDVATLHRRLVEPSGLLLAEQTFFGEPRVHFEPYWNRIPMRWKLPLLWMQPFLAKAFLRPLGANSLGAACGVALRLVKPLQPED
ncbi:MAG: SAM-dependent methyltransferase [Chloroflexota bacterium]